MIIKLQKTKKPRWGLCFVFCVFGITDFFLLSLESLSFSFDHQ